MTGDYLVKVGAVGVGDEDLAKTVAGHDIDDALHTAGVQLVKDVVEQQDGHGGIVGFEKVELGKPEGYRVGLTLPLAARAPHGIAIEHQFQVVAVDAASRVPDNEVALACGGKMLLHRAVVEVALVVQAHGFALAGHGIVVVHEDGQELLHPLAAPLMNHRRMARHFRLHGLIQQRVAHFLLDHGVALLDGLVIADDGIEVLAVVLRDDLVHETPALLTAATHQVPVHGRHHDNGQQADVLAQPLILLAVVAHDLALAALQGDADFQRRLLAGVTALQHHVGLTVTDDRGVVACRGKAAAHAQVIDRVEHVGLALPVVADQAVQLGRELQSRLGNVLVVDYGGSVQCHRWATFYLPQCNSSHIS